MAVPLAAGAILIGLLLLAHARRVFARFENGVFLAAASTIVTIALVSAAVIGTWGYEASRRIMRSEQTVSLDSIATIVDQELEREIQSSASRLAGLTRTVAPALAPGGDLADLTTSLRAVQDFNPTYLEIAVVDAGGRLAASSDVDDTEIEAPDRIATAFNLEGRTFVSEPRHSAEHGRQVLYISVP